MVANTQPPPEKISAVKQLTVQWPANAHRVTQDIVSDMLEQEQQQQQDQLQ